MAEQPKPPVFVRGGKRLNFDRRDEWDGALGPDFAGYGKDESCMPSCSWEELCAFAKLIVDHPAFRLPDPTDYYPPMIEDESPAASDVTLAPEEGTDA